MPIIRTTISLHSVNLIIQPLLEVWSNFSFNYIHDLIFFLTAKRNTTPKTSNVQNPASRPVEAGPKVNYPLTERQQLQYLLEVTAKEAKQDSGTSSNDDLPIIGSKTKRKDTIKDNHIEARVRKRNERGETALHVAAIRGDLEDVVALIKAGALVNAKDNAGKTCEP